VIKASKVKIALFAFLSLSAITITGGLLYLQSASFGNAIKQMISERSPRKLGVVGDFTNLNLHLFPPGVGVANPKIRIEKDNVTHVPIEGEIEAQELRVSFAPFQMFSGVLQASEVEVRGGAIQGKLWAEAFKDKGRAKKSNANLSWQDLFQLQINGFRFVDTYLNIRTELPGEKHEELVTEFVVKDLKLEKSRFDGKDGFGSNGIVNAVRVEAPTSWNVPIKEANQLQWNIALTEKGLKLDPFVADLSGVRLKLKGGIDGNLLDPSADPIIRADAEVTSDLESFFLTNFDSPAWKGNLTASAKLVGNLKNLAESLKGQFNVECTDFHWEHASASLLKLDGGLDLKSRMLELKSLEAEDRPSGTTVGKLRVRQARIPLRLNEPFSADLDLESGDVHWLGGVVADAMAPLEGGVSGKVSAQFTPEKKGWRLKTSVDLGIEHFALTNQSLTESKPKVFILRPPKTLHLKGGLDIGPNGIDFREMNLGILKTQFKVVGGVHGDTGFDFHARGPVDMK
jgi:hypothetical protein